MTAEILKGKEIASELISKLKKEITIRKQKEIDPPTLAVILIGNDAASEIYVNNKKKACENVGIKSISYNLSNTTTKNDLLELLKELNADKNINGILVQLPLPEHIDPISIIEAIDPLKDVDGFHPYNVGRLAQRLPALRPCTPYGIMQILETIDLDLTNTNSVVIGASNIGGRPMALELLLQGSTVTVCHRFTKNVPEIVKNSDLVIAAAGKPGLIKGEWIKKGAVVIDVGINRLENGKITGDVEFDKAIESASFVTPVPGGVGPMTIVTLLQNTLAAQKLQTNN